MQLNEDTYRYMKRAASQIEGITCALSAYIENAVDAANTYHYRVYHELLNEMRSRHIDAVTQVKDVFGDTRDSIEKAAERMQASDLAENALREELQSFDECLSRLVIHCANIRECDSDTGNPNIPDADDEIYKSFSGYKSLIDAYTLENPPDDDIVSSIIYSFYREAKNIYDHLFQEYDKILNELGGRLRERRQNIENGSHQKALGIVKKGTRAENIGKAAIGAAMGIIGGIGRKEAFSAVDAGLGLIKTISEELEDVLPKKSLARKALRGIESFEKSMELVAGLGIQETFGLEDNTMSAVKMIGAAVGVRAFDLHRLNKEGKMDSMAGAAEATNAWGGVVAAAVSGRPLKALSQLPKAADKTMQFIEAVAKYYGENEAHKLPKGMDLWLHHLARTIKDYESEAAEYKANLIRGIPARKPKAPPWMQVHKGISFTAGKIDTMQKIIGGGYNDIVAKVL